MSDGNKALKLSGEHANFNLNLKTVLSSLFDAQKAIYTKKAVPETFDFLVSVFSVRHFRSRRNTGGQEKRNYELRVSFCNSPIF